MPKTKTRSEVLALIESAPDTIAEISWVTGPHHRDPQYEVGVHLTPDAVGDYTTHPDYHGTSYERRDDAYSDQQEWMRSNLPPESGNINAFQVITHPLE